MKIEVYAKTKYELWLFIILSKRSESLDEFWDIAIKYNILIPLYEIKEFGYYKKRLTLAFWWHEIIA